MKYIVESNEIHFKNFNKLYEYLQNTDDVFK